ncbi:translocation/assembly module TamB domain-containing protein [Azoarcus sp. PA01]|nr:translocation/assembly module TamB domain-containing protein [Azoarcus sp. PA01]
MAPAVETSVRRPFFRIAAGLLLVVLLLVVAAALFATWLVRTESGLRLAADAVGRLSGGQVVVENAAGRLAGPLRIGALRVATPDLRLRLDNLALQWNPVALLFDRHLDIASVTIDEVTLARRPADAPAPSQGPPATLELPFSLSLRALQVGRVAVLDWPAEGANAAPAEAVKFELSSLAATLASDGRHHRIEALSATLPFGQASLSGEIDGGAAPFALSASGALQGERAGHAYTLNLRADGDLVAPHLLVEAEGAGLSGSADILAAPFEPVPLRRLRAALGDLDPSAFQPDAPKAALRVEADLTSAPGEAWVLSGPITIENRAPGTLDRNAVPVERIAAQLRWTPTETSADSLLVELPGAGTVAGNVHWSPDTGTAFGRVTAMLQLAGIDPARLDARLPKSEVAGTVEAAGDASRQTAQLELRVGAARIRADGELTATDDGAQTLVATGQLAAFDPHALLGRAPVANLNMSFELRGELGEPRRFDVRWQLQPSRLEGRPLNGNGHVVIDGERLADSDIDLTLARNRVQVKGAWGGRGDELQIDVDAPALAALGDEFGGRARLQGTVSGTLERPGARFDLSATALRVPGGLRVAGVDAHGRFADGIDGPLELALDVSGLGRGEDENLIDRAKLGVSGKGTEHVIDFTASGLEDDTVRMRLEGRLVRTPEAGGSANAAGGARGAAKPDSAPPADPRARFAWQGRATTLETGGRFEARLTSPAQLQVGAERIALGTATFDAGERGRIRLDETQWTPQSIAARGSLTGLALRLASRPDGRSEGRREGSVGRERGALVLGAEWDVQLGQSANGRARVYRESGDLSVSGELPARLGLEHLEARLTARDNRLALSLDARGSELGELVGSATALAERDADAGWRLVPDAALLGSARLEMPSIAWLGRLMQENIVTGGSLAADFALAGTAADPRASGSVDGRGLSVALVDEGLQLSGGELRAEFDRDRLRLVRLEFVSPNRVRPADGRVPVARFTREPGRLTASGQIALDSGTGRFVYQADRLPILQRPDRWLILSGGGTAQSTWTSLHLEAEFRADAGYVELADSPPPSLSEDVVILGRETPSGKGGFKLSADVLVALGENLYLSALGVDTRLAGELQLRVRDGERLSAIGTIATVGGTYQGYGQSLVIERGRINFQGPLNNPGLNIVALRKGLAVEAGVAIVGSARRPQVRLVSEPNVPDPEKLSWLVLGRPPTAGGGADLGLLLPAAQALFGGPGGGITEQLSRSLGFDQFSIGQGELSSVTRGATSRVVGEGSVVTGEGTVSGQVLSVGKRLSSDLFLSFEQSLGGAESLVKLTYQLTRQVSVVARGGSDNSADVYYTISFK